MLLLGARGQLGQALAAQLRERADLVSLSRADLDVSDTAAIRAAVRSIRPAVIVNCTAYNAVDAAETHPLETFAVNAWAVRTLARVAAEHESTLVHFSTDFVFDGHSSAPYTEQDPPNPRSTYATSKLLGEWFAAEAARHYVLRVESLFGGPHRRSSVDRILDALLEGTDVRAFSDRTVSPSYVPDVVEATMALLEREAPYGLYHCVNGGWTTWVGLAREMARLARAEHAAIVEISMAATALAAERPLFAALSNAKLAAAGIPMPGWEDAIRRYVTERLRPS